MFDFLADEVDVQTVTTTWITVGTIVALFAVIVALSLLGKNLSARTIAMAGITIALSFVLSLFKIVPIAYGGGITIASVVPIAIFAYFYGFFPGLLSGLIFGLLQFISEPYLLTPLTFFLDYALPFIGISLIPICKKFVRSETRALILGLTVTYVIDFIFHFFSGIIYFNYGYLIEGIPAGNAALYSLLYNLVYIGPDFAIAAVVTFILSKTKLISRLEKIAVSK